MLSETQELAHGSAKALLEEKQDHLNKIYALEEPGLGVSLSAHAELAKELQILQDKLSKLEMQSVATPVDAMDVDAEEPAPLSKELADLKLVLAGYQDPPPPLIYLPIHSIEADQGYGVLLSSGLECECRWNCASVMK